MERGSRTAYAGVLIAIVAYSWAAILIRWAEEASPLVIAFYRMAIASVVFAPLYFLQPKKRRTAKLSAKQSRWIIIAGVALAFHFATWISSLRYTTVSSSVFLILTQPIMVAIVAHFTLHEKLNRVNLIAMAMTVFGSLIIFGGDFAVSQRALFGDVLAVLGAMGAGIYLFSARIVRPDRGDGDSGVPLLRYLPPVYGIAAVLLGVMALVNGDSFWPLSGRTWLALLALGLVPQVIGHSLLNWSLRYLPALPVNISLVGEPVGASLLAFLLLDEIPSTGLLFGSPILIVAVVMIFLHPPKTLARATEIESPLGG